MINSIVQTGANSQDGGVKKGLFNPAYQTGIAGVVNIEPRNPADRQSKTQAISLKRLFLFIHQHTKATIKKHLM
jgi:hypothetical protein